MIVLTKDLTGAALDWAVARAEGLTVRPDVWHAEGVTVGEGDGDLVLFAPSTDPADGYPIIERERILVGPWRRPPETWDKAADSLLTGQWFAQGFDEYGDYTCDYPSKGPTPLIAAMRCHVAHKLGPSIDIPEELLL